MTTVCANLAIGGMSISGLSRSIRLSTSALLDDVDSVWDMETLLRFDRVSSVNPTRPVEVRARPMGVDQPRPVEVRARPIGVD